MRILVCVKGVPDAGEAQIAMDTESHTLRREHMRMVLNPVDGCSFETALRLKERYGGSVSLMTMGPPKAGELLRSLSAVGGDAFYLISDPAYAGADTYATARTLCGAAVYLGGFDLILCGERTTDGETGQVGPSLAAMLGWNFAGCVTGIGIRTAGEQRTAGGKPEPEPGAAAGDGGEAGMNGGIAVSRVPEADGGGEAGTDRGIACCPMPEENGGGEAGTDRRTVVCRMPDAVAEYPLPLVMTVRRNCVLRYPGLAGLRRSANTQIQILNTAVLGEAARSLTKVVKVEKKEIGMRRAVWYAPEEKEIERLLRDAGIGDRQL